MHITVLLIFCVAGCAFGYDERKESAPRDPGSIEGYPLMKDQVSGQYFYQIGVCDPRVYPNWTSVDCAGAGAFWGVSNDCLAKQLVIDKKACSDGPALAQQILRIPLCSETTRLHPGLSKKQVSKIFGSPTYSALMTCGGAPGVARWQCERVTYSCRNNGYAVTELQIWYSNNHVNSWGS